MGNTDLTLDRIKITPQLIKRIEELQSPPCNNLEEINYGLACLIEKLTNLNVIIVRFYLVDPDIIEAKECMEALADIQYLKERLAELAAPQHIEQTTI